MLDEYMKVFPTRINLMHFSHFIFTKGKPGALGPPGHKGAKGDMVTSRVKGECD